MTGPVRSVSQAFAIMRLLSGASPLSLSDIGRATGLSPSSGLNLLKTLVEEGAVVRDARTKTYRLAPAWGGFGALGDGDGRLLVDRAEPLLTSFAQQSDAAVGLWKVVARDRLQLVARAESDAGMRLQLADGQRQPLGGGAAGRALAADQRVDEAELARRYAQVRWQADLPVDAYIQQVREVAQRGFAIDDGLAHRGVVTVAVGIAEVQPGFCLSASILAGTRSAAEIAALGAGLRALRGTLLPGQ